MRIIGGKYRGLTLPSPADRSVRPTTDRLRERLFNILTHRDDPALWGARVADLFAGTGALGFEALSRGAAHVSFVEKDPAARRAIQQTAARMKAEAGIAIHACDAGHLPPGAAVDLIFLDPPYGRGLLAPALDSASRAGWVRPGTLAVCELEAGEVPEWPSHWIATDRRAQKNTQIVFLRYTP